MFPGFKKAITPTSLLGQSQGSDIESYGDSYFREIGFKIGENSFEGSTESPNQDGQEALGHVDLDSGLANYSVPETTSTVTSSSKRPRAKSKHYHRLTMADAYGTPTHLVRGKSLSSDPRSTDRGLRRGEIDEYAITLRKNTSDELTISTLGEESIKRKPSPLYAQQLYNATHQKSFVKPPIRPQIEALDLKKASTGSTLEERPSEDSRDRHPKATVQQQRPNQVPDDGVPKKRWGLIYFVFGSSLILLAASSVVIGVCMVQWLSQGQSEVSGEEEQTSDTWVPQNPEGWGNVTANESGTDAVTLAREDLLQVISNVSPESLAAVSNTTTPQFQAFEWTVHDANYFGYDTDRIVQRWSMAVIFVSLGKSSSLTMDAHECLWYSTDVEDVCDDNGNMVSLHLADSGLNGSIPPEVSLLGGTLERLNLPSNNITGTIPSEIGSLTNLVRLQLDSNELEGSIPSEMERLSNLIILSLGQNQISGTIPTVLANLGRLASMVVEGNKLQGPVPSELGSMLSLQILNLKSNHLNGTLPTELGNLQHLNFLSLYQNNIGGTMPDEVCMNNEQNSQFVVAADCSEVECSCCTLCCFDCSGDNNGTLVTLSTTNATDVPCPTTLSVNKTCFVQNNDTLEVEFQNCEATEGDWIGLYKDGYVNKNPLSSLVSPEDGVKVWTRPCGDLECTEPVFEGSVSLGRADLEVGMYIMVLKRQGVQVATTSTFEVRPECK